MSIKLRNFLFEINSVVISTFINTRPFFFKGIVFAGGAHLEVLGIIPNAHLEITAGDCGEPRIKPELTHAK